MNLILFLSGLLSWSVSAETLPNRYPAPGKVENSKQFRITEYTTLSEISMFLYGTLRMVPELAKSNGLTPPYQTIQQNSVLSLPKPPFLSEEQGLILMQRMWTKQRCAALHRTYQEGVDEETCLLTKQETRPKIQAPVTVVKTPLDHYQEWKAKERETLGASVLEKKRIIEGTWLKAQEWMSTSNFVNAETELSRLIEMEPQSPRGWLGLIQAQIRGKATVRAEGTACEFVRKFPRLKGLHFIRGLISEKCSEGSS